MGRRASLSSLSPTQQRQLVDHLFVHLTDALLAEHLSLDHGSAVLTDHRQLVSHMEAHVAHAVALPDGLMPKWDPATPIPSEFQRVRPSDAGSPRPALVNLAPNLPTPENLLPPQCWRHERERDFAAAVNPWHGRVHDAVGGTMADPRISPAAAIFWPWHAWIDDLYEDYLSGSTLTSAPCVVREGEQRLALFYRARGDWLAWRPFDGRRWQPEERFGEGHQFPTRMPSDVFQPDRTPAVVSDWNGHRFAVFYRGEGDRMRWKAHHGGRWHADAPLEGGGPVTSNPAVVKVGNQLGLFYRGANDWLVWRLHDGARWHGEECFDDRHRVPTKLGASFTDPVRSPAVLGDWQGHRFAVYFRGEGDRLHWKAHHGGDWHGHAEVRGGGRMSSDPAVAAAGGETGVFYRGEHDALVWRANRSGGDWHPEERFDSAHPLASRMSSAPTAVAGWRGHPFAVYFRAEENWLRWKAHHGGTWHHDAFVM